MMNEERLKILFIASLCGDKEAYGQFLQKVIEILRGYLRKAMKNQSLGLEAEDLVQEVLIAIHHKRELFDPSKPLMPWLYAMAKYRLIDAYRSSLRKPRFTELHDSMSDDFYLENLVSAKRGEDDDARLLEGLTEKQKEVLWLSKVEEMPLVNVAEETGLSHSSVKVTIHRSLKMLKEKLKK